MQLTKTYNWMRRDFSFNATCEGCKHEEKNISGYDDRNFYDNVIPDMRCTSCGESSNSLGATNSKIATKYNPNTVI